METGRSPAAAIPARAEGAPYKNAVHHFAGENDRPRQALFGFTATALVATGSAAQPQPLISTPDASPAAEQDDEIVVEAQRLSRELKNTRLLLVRPNNRLEFEIRADGAFKSPMNGLQSDFGTWRVDGSNLCFDGRARGTFCSAMLFGRHTGVSWITTGLDGKRYEARLTAY